MASEPWIAEHLRYRGILCVVMVIAGVISLGGGVALLWFGAKDTSIWVDAPSFKLTGTGLGGLTMAASVAWGALAYLARPEVSYEDSEAKFSLVAERTSEISQDRLNTNRVVAFVLGLATGIVGTVVVRMLG